MKRFMLALVALTFSALAFGRAKEHFVYLRP